MHMDTSRAVGIFAGGVIGTMLRVVLTGTTTLDAWPVWTLVVNVLGAAALAFWLGYVEIETERMRDFLQIGLLGSFTTFSTFAVEVTQLLDEPLKAISYAVVSIGLGLAAASGGLSLGDRVGSRRPQVLEGY